MNALEEIERQLRVSVTARKPQTDAPTADPQATNPPLRMRQMTRRSNGRGIRKLAAAATIAAVTLAIALVPLDSTSGPTPAAAAALRELARIAAGGPSLVPGPGQYLYTRSEGRSAAFRSSGGSKECVSYGTDQRQLWVGANGSGLLREQAGPNAFTSGPDRAVCASMRMTRTSGTGVSNLWFAADCFQLGPAQNMSRLSTDPRILLRQMRRLDGGPRTPAEDFVHVGDFLRETDASPALRAALYRAAALIPGVRLLGTVRDHIGRRGLGVMMVVRHVRNELIFDRRTAALLAEQSSGTAAGSNTWTVYLKAVVVSKVPYPSPVPLTTPCHNSMGYARRVPGGTTMTGRPIR